LQLDKHLYEKGVRVEVDTEHFEQIFEKKFVEFCAEIDKGTEIIVVDHTNLCEGEYQRFVQKAQGEHYFVSIVHMPPPEISTAVKRSTFDVTDDVMTQMMSKWEPYSPGRLSEKTHSLTVDQTKPHKMHSANSFQGLLDTKKKPLQADVIAESNEEDERHGEIDSPKKQ